MFLCENTHVCTEHTLVNINRERENEREKDLDAEWHDNAATDHPCMRGVRANERCALCSATVTQHCRLVRHALIFSKTHNHTSQPRLSTNR